MRSNSTFKTTILADAEVFPVDHNISYSLYINDPDGNRLELYVDGATGWEGDPSLILTETKKLDLTEA